MTTVTVLGLGPMGKALTTAFVTAGHQATAWSRTAATPAPDGATRARTPAEAIAASELTVVCVRGDAAVATILDGLDLTGAPWSTSPRARRNKPEPGPRARPAPTTCPARS